MKQEEIAKGKTYRAKVNNRITTVRVDDIRKIDSLKRQITRYDVTNLETGRTTSFRSARKFISAA